MTEHVDLTRMAAALHVSNGDATDLAGTGLARHIIYWRDTLHEGPVPALPPEELRRVRAAFLMGAGADDRAEGLRMFEQRDAALEAHRDGEYVLWFEADLYDQLQIVEILSRLAELKVPAERVTLVCVGEHPGIARFGGLGQLRPDQLAALPATGACAALTPAAFDLATRAWDAFRAPTPEGLPAIAADRSPELRFLGEAFERLSREYPSTRDGLSLTERRVLAAAEPDGGSTAGDVFARASAREARPYIGDTWYFATIDRLAGGPHPLLSVEPAGRPVGFATEVRLTRAGARVLEGEADHVTLNGVDRWIGGVHLTGRDVRWRWDEGRERLTGTA
ncbi:unnamed protein product [[Actinomadura] parvosata subsp. kistnae]|uniref:DUF1835 domain-containing protein n=1 Tax=[Actinomadura] parvosata subsp. kistnae TaxID=1909395 RepID=A0A1U9ZVW4_9ACTN|nr:hypothetical protein [Nonomuraea sp. ATCC 55076]AQZ62080.1 hypothetical protein BKM31_11900 [Nonomuraea sp. ATCC 55076]SPL89426.1 unnamed protein product [Actinomadura parvosata subsp. kistnae]